jgi:transcriptional regulator with XRE-family HTH domain
MICVMTVMDEVLLVAWLRAGLASGLARQIRVQGRLSQGDVALAMEVPQPTVARWEAGRMPRREHAARYARFLQELDQISRTGEPAQP